MSQLLNEMMDFIHDRSLSTIELLQKSFPNNESIMINISILLDPRYVFLIYAPLLFAFNKRVGHRMVLALTLAEWSNQVLKWLLAGERPYWYVHERANELRLGADLANNRSVLDAVGGGQSDVLLELPPTSELKQFPVTCEMGAGSPSGHAMVTATVWYILVDAYLKGELPALGRANYAQLSSANRHAASKKVADDEDGGAGTLTKLSWSVYALILLAVSMSRVYLACHFPHQCVCGALLGALTARLVTEHAPMEKLRTVHFAQLTVFMMASALGTYALLRASGFDPLWSVDKALRWCAKKEYIQLDTTPFFSMMRYLSFCLGSGLAYDAQKIVQSGASEPAKGNGLLLVRRLVCAALAVLFGQFLLALPLPRANMNLFYALVFLLFTTFSYAIAGPIPRLAKSLVPGAKQKAN